MTSKTLVLIRHAKSSWKDSTLADFDRPLNKRGKQDAPMMGEILASKELRPEAFYLSPAKRSKKTAEKIAEKIAFPQHLLKIEDQLYFGGSEKIVQWIKKLNNHLHTIFIVSHNPDLNDLAAYFLGSDFFNRQIQNLPTASLLALQIPVESWHQIERGKANPLFYEYPKKYKSNLIKD
ncbi:SixA phosphatase family protein [Hugenholtzia roseola]|uniref:SixA phosphatase family protein n=1 Tax=Hugenholtzia roseola TaxID=1002 RepID=UPI00040DDC05|nr:histidine phosphatase family protein [Hugenholtzia roseola]